MKTATHYTALIIALILTILWVGGITRLTNSGLSITEWQLISGFLPPFTDEAWQIAFGKYQTIPQYKALNLGMSLEDFKFIFFWEWFHRLIGRTLGLIAILGTLHLGRRKLWPNRTLQIRSWIGCGLIALQGAIGWYMVKSGLNQGNYVSPYRLSIHLSTALVILFYWTSLYFETRAAITRPAQPSPKFRAQKISLFWPLFVFALQIVYGAWVAGMKAGYAYPTYPLMGGSFFPTQDWIEGQGISAFYINPMVIQFVHRWLAVLVVIVFGVTGKRLLACLDQNHEFDRSIRKQTYTIATLLGLQFLLGVLTLVLGVPWFIGSLHQLNAGLIVFALARLSFSLKRANP